MVIFGDFDGKTCQDLFFSGPNHTTRRSQPVSMYSDMDVRDKHGLNFFGVVVSLGREYKT